jgi:hypothetical protein
MSRSPPIAVATIGLPAAAASSATSPNGSGHSDGATLNIERRSASIATWCGHGPITCTPGLFSSSSM